MADRRRAARGFSMVEALISLSLGTVFLTTVMSAWWFTTRAWKEENVRSRLRYDIERAMEELKEDVRLSDSNKLLFYPSAAASYTAISIPRADLVGGFIATVSPITYTDTVIYHAYDTGSGIEMRRTVYPYNSSSAARQAQLDACVLSGGAGGTSETLFTADTGALTVTPDSPSFDGYAATASRSSAAFGSIRLSAGAHTVRFEVVGQNAASTGYRIGIDSIALTPSGGTQEGEVLTVNASSGDALVTEDMSAVGVWSGNMHREFRADAVNDYVTFDTYYDRWLESNFASMTHINTAVSTPGNPTLTILSREEQSLTPAFMAETMTLVSPADEALTDQSVRTVIPGTAFTRTATMVRIKFTASEATGPLRINAAYFGQRAANADYLVAPVTLYFDNAPFPTGDTDGVGATDNPGTNTAVTLNVGESVWSNWFEYTIAALPAPDFLVSMNVDAGNASSWTPSPSMGTLSYRLDDAADSYSAQQLWSTIIAPPALVTSDAVYAVDQIATWIGSGTATSQVYDTKLSAPVYGSMSWTATLPAGATITLKVRADSNANMSGAPDWSALPAYAASPQALGAVDNERYVQFQATLTAASPYTTMPTLDDVTIPWPGTTSLVEVSGTYTKRPNYGMFRVLVDGTPLVKSLGFTMTATEDFRDTTHQHSLSAEVQPRNTGK